MHAYIHTYTHMRLTNKIHTHIHTHILHLPIKCIRVSGFAFHKIEAVWKPMPGLYVCICMYMYMYVVE